MCCHQTTVEVSCVLHHTEKIPPQLTSGRETSAETKYLVLLY